MKKAFRLSAWITAAAMAVSLLPMGAFAAPAAPETTNTIAEGAYTKEGTQWYVSFNDLETEADYIVIVSRSAEQPLAAENLVYLTETASTDTGTLTVPFRAAAEDIRYAVACRPGKIPESRTVRVNGGTADLEQAAAGAVVTITAPAEQDGKPFARWKVEAGDITLAEETARQTTFVMGSLDVEVTACYDTKDSPTPAPGGDGDGGGAIIALAAGAAAVAVAVGVVTTVAPVAVRGRVELADHTVPANARISLLQDGKVVAQTTANAEGSFELKVKRGNYELTAVYTDANGQLVHKTIQIKAPVKGLTMTL